MNKKMSKEMLESIKNYSKEIVTLKSFIDAVRKVPGMYIGHVGNRGFLNMIREVFQNAVDQMMRQDSPCTQIILSYDERNHTVIVEDNGMGIPFNDMVRIYTQQHTGSNFIKKEGQFSSGLHGVGGKVTNALCSWFKVESFILGEGKVVEFFDGIPDESKTLSIPNKDNKQGTIVTFRPSYEVMGDIDLKCDTILNLVRTITSLTNIGSKVIFNCIKKDGSVHNETIINEDGIVSNLVYKTERPLLLPIVIADEVDDKKVEIAFTYDIEDMTEDDIVGFSNFCPTIAGTHMKGFVDGITKFFKDYMNKIYLNKRSKIKINNTDVKSGLRAIIAASHLHPIFSGQAKDELSNEDMEPYVKDVVIKSLDLWSQSNPNDLQKVAKYLKEVAEIRTKSEEGKIKLSSQYKSSSITGLPSKYEKPIGRKDLELIIVEGDSAGGSAKRARCPYRQGVFPIRGKMPNAFTTDRNKYLSNAEVAGLINIIGAGYGRSFDIDKVKFSKIVQSADADADGSHIHTLILSLFLLYMSPIIEHGLLYKSVPPLYGMKKGKKTIYFTDKIGYVRHIQSQFSKKNIILSLGGTTISSNDVIELLYRNIEYVYEVEMVSNTYALDPELLELVLIYRNSTPEELRKIIKNKFRFMDLYIENNTILIKGLIRSKSQMLFLTNRLLEDSKEVIKYIDEVNSTMFYNLNNEIVSIYNLMKAFEKSDTSRITRYKGLGEMDTIQLKESTIHPDSNRTLIQYTIKDVKEEIALMRKVQSNKNKLINDIKLSRHEILG